MRYRPPMIRRRLRRFIDATAGTASDLARGLTRADMRQTLWGEVGAATAAAGLLPWLVRSWRGGTILDAALRNAEDAPDELAFVMGDERLTWKQLDVASSKVAHDLHWRGVRPGQVVGLLAGNSPRYVATLLGIARVGATAALINHHLAGRPLAHAVTSAKAVQAIADDARAGGLREALSESTSVVTYAELDAASHPAAPFPPARGDGDYVFIYTSGTTGLPKPCRISHARALLAGAAFGNVLFAFEPGDVLYSVLPLYHASALLLGVGSCVLTRTPMALRESFSAREFWPDVTRYGATAILYIGELCRYLVASPPHPDERNHSIRVAVGNGLRPDVWERLEERFAIPTVREFYAATEAPGFIVNLAGRIGSVGRVPLRRGGPLRLAKFDVGAGSHPRDDDGFMMDCDADEAGELLVHLPNLTFSAATEFLGYTDGEATEAKILRNCFLPGDRYFRTGDLLRRDADDFFYFVDRIGDTFRWKGENVSTAEVADVLATAPGVAEATVVGVEVPGHEGKAGLVAIVLEPGHAFAPASFWKAAQELPAYAQPRFVRVIDAMQTTGTYKIQKTQLEREGVTPGEDVFCRTDAGYEPLDANRWSAIEAGRLRL